MSAIHTKSDPNSNSSSNESSDLKQWTLRKESKADPPVLPFVRNPSQVDIIPKCASPPGYSRKQDEDSFLESVQFADKTEAPISSRNHHLNMLDQEGSIYKLSGESAVLNSINE